MYGDIERLRGAVPMAFLPDYDIALARKLVSGADLWLNTPQPPLEASGTSGMKAALNGVPSLSVLDGWWVEGCIEGVTGWAIGKEGDAPESHGKALYDSAALKRWGDSRWARRRCTDAARPLPFLANAPARKPASPLGQSPTARRRGRDHR